MFKKVQFFIFCCFIFAMPINLLSQQVNNFSIEEIALAENLLKNKKVAEGDMPIDEDDLFLSKNIEENSKKSLKDIKEPSTQDLFIEIEDRIKLLNIKKSIGLDNDLTEEDKSFLLSKEKAGPVYKKYGYDFFEESPQSFSSSGDLPLPNDYKISLRDQFSVILTGSKKSTFNLNVKLDGTILFPELGSITVVNQTLEDVRAKISELVNQSYIGTSVDISLNNLSAKKITIVGAVESPGTYLVNPFSTITSALAYSGGIEEIGTLRNIKLLKTNGDLHTFDLYDLLIKGDRSKDLTIDAGDVILIEPANQFINLKGRVKRPGIYEIKEDEILEDIINYGLGFEEISNQSKISISKLNLLASSIDQFEATNLEISLKNVISVDVFEYKSNEKSGIFVSGAVRETGYYDATTFSNLSDLIETVELVNVYPFLAVLEQFDDKSLVTSSILFNLNDPNSYNSIKLLPNSKVFFLEILEAKNYKDLTIKSLMNLMDYLVINENSQDLISDYMLTINHKDNKYMIPIIGYFNIKSFTDLLGLDMSDIDRSSATYINPTDNFISVGDYYYMNFTAKKFHDISFRSPLNTLLSIEITGEVLYPGTYSINNGSTLADLYKLSGGFNDIANEDGVVLKRTSVANIQFEALKKAQLDLNNAIIMNSQRGNSQINPNAVSALSTEINIENLGRIAGNYSPQNQTINDFILVDEDKIFIPKQTNTLSVLGEVLNPNSFPFSKKISVNEAIRLAGGTKDFADNSNIYVIHANGLISKADRNIFSGRAIKLSPGDTIIVPRKIQSDGELARNITAFSSIISNIAFSAAALQSLQGNNSN